VKRVLRWAGFGLAGVVAVAAALGGYVWWKSNAGINRRYAVPNETVPIPADSASLARGRHLADAIGKCGDCHMEGLAGGLAIDDGAFMRLAAGNLTRGACGWGNVFTDADWVRAIRHGVGRDGKGLVLMPSEAYVHLTDADLGALIAYLKSLPPLDFCPPHRNFGPIARLLLAQGRFPLFAAASIDHSAVRSVSGPAHGVTPEYGRYLAQVGGCLACHGEGLSGGPVPGAPPGAPPASNLTPSGLGSYTEEDFFRLLREGRKPGGVELSDFMPWRASGRMTDDEIRAVWLFLRSVPPREFGNR
jgi:mono/diheme cytochrome c family protein